MATDLQIEYSPHGIRTLRERRFAVQPAQEVEPSWAVEIARLSASRRIVADVIGKSHEFARRFHDLAMQWKNETAHQSVTFKRAMHPAYQQIIGMGEKALPFIFEELRHQPSGNWFWALHAITGQDIAETQDSIDSAITAWLNWGMEHGHIK